ncbi:HU family DNA-binding protein [Parabacteroides sp. APC149_11_2_Y6]
MNKTEFIKRMSKRLSLPSCEVSCFLHAFNEELVNVFQEDDRLIMQGFGSYCLYKRAERVGRNPKTGEKCVIPSNVSIKFRPGKELLNKLNQDMV